MKKLIFLFLFFNCALRAQDTIRFSNGNILAAKVIEVGETEIKYNRFDNVNGPLYVAEKYEVKSIKYSNGSVDVFNAAPPKTEKPVVQQQNQLQFSYQKIEINGYRLYYNGNRISDRMLLNLINNCPDVSKRDILKREKTAFLQYRNRQSIYLWLFYGGMGVAVSGIMSNSGSGVMAFFVGTGASITGGILSTMYKNKRRQKCVDIAHIYNDDKYEFR